MVTGGLIEATPAEIGSGQQYQRETFSAHGLVWAVVALPDFGSGETLAVSTSDDGGETWTTPDPIVEGIAGTGVSVGSYGTAAHWDGQFLHIVVSGQGEITMRYRRGEPQSNGTITWSDDLQDVLTAVGLAEVDITVTEDGRPVIGYEHFNNAESGYPRPMVTMSSTNDGTWSTAAGFPFRLDTEVTFNWVGVADIGGGEVLAVWWDGSVVSSRVWDGGDWGSIEAVDDEDPAPDSFSFTAHALVSDPATGRAWMVYPSENGGLVCKMRDPSTGWQAAEEVTSDPAQTASIGFDAGNDELYVAYVEEASAEIKYAVRTSSGWDGGGTLLWDVSGDGYDAVKPGSLQISERADGGQFVLLWQGEAGFGIGGVHGLTLEVEVPAEAPATYFALRDEYEVEISGPAARTLNGTDQLLYVEQAPFSPVPAEGATLAVWHRTTDSQDSGTLICVGSGHEDGHYLTLGVIPGNYAFAEFNGGNYTIAYETDAAQQIGAHEWHHFAVVFGHDPDGEAELGYITVYVDGVPGVPQPIGGTVPPGNLDRVSVGGEWGAHQSTGWEINGVSVGNARAGAFNHVYIFGEALALEDVEALAGLAPMVPFDPVWLYLLHGEDDPEPEHDNGPALDLEGSPGVAVHAPLAPEPVTAPELAETYFALRDEYTVEPEPEPEPATATFALRDEYTVAPAEPPEPLVARFALRDEYTVQDGGEAPLPVGTVMAWTGTEWHAVMEHDWTGDGWDPPIT